MFYISIIKKKKKRVHVRMLNAGYFHYLDPKNWSRMMRSMSYGHIVDGHHVAANDACQILICWQILFKHDDLVFWLGFEGGSNDSNLKVRVWFSHNDGQLINNKIYRVVITKMKKASSTLISVTRYMCVSECDYKN